MLTISFPKVPFRVWETILAPSAVITNGPSAH